MPIAIRRLAESFVGEVSGADLAQLDAAAVEAVKSAWLAHKVLVFHDQHLDDARQLAFSRNFGALEQATGDITQGAERRAQLTVARGLDC